MADVHVVKFCEQNITFLPKYYEDIDGFSHTYGGLEPMLNIWISNWREQNFLRFIYLQ